MAREQRSQTERLYYTDSHLIEFEAQVVDKTWSVSGWTALVLDRTAFHPTGGGQPSDTGTLNGIPVVECIDDNDRVLHVIHEKAPEFGTVVKGRVDWPRRLDHMQQHTGQHILSQAFVKLHNAPTRSFRVGHQFCEIDIELGTGANQAIDQALDLANQIIWEDRPIIVRQVTPEEAARLPLRKDSAREGELRVIEIEGFDLTPCGGTHAHRTGEVGMIVIRSWERAKGLIRIEFAAGGRALTDYRSANNAARVIAALFSSGRDDTPDLVVRMIEENKELQRRIRTLEEAVANAEAQELLAGAKENESGLKVVAKIFENRDAESLKRLALAIIRQSKTVALLGSRENETARLVFARAEDATGDMNVLMRAACTMLDGRGGGKPELAQGGGRQVDKLDTVISQAAQSLV